MVHFDRFDDHILFCLGISLGHMFYKNPAYPGSKSICELHEMDDLYICCPFVQYHSNDPPTLEHLTTFYLGKFYKKTQKLQWSQPLAVNALDIIHGIKQSTKLFDSIM